MKRTAFYSVLLLFFGMAAVINTASAQSNPVFTIENVEVDVTAESAVKAREEAFAKAQIDAFTTLARRLLSEREISTFSVPELSYISPLVQDFEITQEQLSNVRYKAKYVFRFKEEDVRRFLGGHGVVHAQVKQKTMLILPFYQWDTRAVLWGQNNPWLASWNNSFETNQLLPVAIPIGDLADMMDIEDDQALTYDPRRLNRIKRRYHTEEAVILIAALDNGKPHFNPTAIADTTMTIYVYKAGEDAPEYLHTLKVVPSGEETFSKFFERAVIETKSFLSSGLNTLSTRQTVEETNSIHSVVPFSSMREWVELQKLLRQIKEIRQIDILSLKPQKAEIRITFSGNARELQRTLSGYNIDLSPHYTGYAGTMATPAYFILQKRRLMR